MAPDSDSLDEVRARLRDLGYLRGPLSGLTGWIVSGRLGAGGASSFARISLAAGLRLALAGGPILGCAAAALIALSNRPHFSSPVDLAVLALYLSVVFALVLWGLELFTDSILARLARRGFVLVGGFEKAAGRVGLLFSLATTLYLAYLLRGGRGIQAGSGRWEGTLDWLLWGALIVAVAGVGHLIGRLIRLEALLCLMAAGGGQAMARTSGRPRLVMAVTLAALTLLAGGLILLPGRAAPATLRPASPFTRSEFSGRLLVVGVDGLDAVSLDRAANDPESPSLSDLFRRGARVEVEPEASPVPPEIWTTLATGRPPSEHGILGFEARYPWGISSPIQAAPLRAARPSAVRLLVPPLLGPATPVTGSFRRAPAIWEIIHAGGVPTASLNWWATWPASAADGTIVTERLFPRLAAGQLPDRDAWPESLQADLAARFPDDMRLARMSAEQAGIPSDRGPALTAALIDGYHALLAGRILEEHRERVVFLYLPALDILRNQEETGAARQIDVSAGLRHVDRILGDLMRRLEPQDLLLLVTDSGRPDGHSGPAPSGGVMLVWGARVQPIKGDSTASARDLVPTLLALTGFPQARDLRGRPIPELLDPPAALTLAKGPIDTFGDRHPPALEGPEDPFDKEVLDRLQSLGYIQ